MSETLFDRKCVLVVGKPPPEDFVQVVPDALRIEDLRMSFKIEKDDKPEPNKCEVAITNLSQKSRAALQAKGIRVILQAGYTGTLAQIFSGDARTVDHVREGANWVTKIQCGDGERAYQFARVSESFKSGVKLGDVVMKAIKATGLDPGNAAKQVAKIADTFVSGYVVHGRASSELTRLLRPRGWEWSIQDGRFELLQWGETLAEEAPLLSPGTGLIGSPEHCTSEKRNGPAVLKLKVLLQPRLRPGSKVVVKSESVNGTMKVVKLTHSGDTAGPDWYTDIEAVPAV